MPNKLIPIRHAAEILGVSTETLRNWDNCGKLQAVRDKNNNYRYYNISRLQTFAQKNSLKTVSQKIKLLLDD